MEFLSITDFNWAVFCCICDITHLTHKTIYTSKNFLIHARKILKRD